MKSINVEVGGLVSSLSAEGVRRKLLQLPGVHHADVNYVAGSATVHLDEGQLSVEDLRQRIAECGYHCRGEQTPKHVCAPAAGVSADPSHAVHGHHGAPARQAQEMGHEGHHAHAPATAARAKAAATTPAAHAAHQAHAGDPAMADMMHDMGHGSGSMQDMARDMRNRFFVALVFAIPVFFYSPMGKMFGDFQTQFGLDDKLCLFFLAS
ncbi:MAG: heavy metal-associated domain-containing protein, partial [Curvibacter sp.]